MSLWDDLDSLLDSPDSFAVTAGERGTIHPTEDFNVFNDVEELNNAVEGLGTKEEVLINILTCRSNIQRQIIRETYLESTGRTLLDDLKGDTDGDFENLLVALVKTPAEYDSHEITKAMKGCGIKSSVLIEIFASRSNQQIQAFCDAYLEEHEKKLSLDLKSEISGDFADAILLLAEGSRDESTDVDHEMAHEDAQTLYSAGEKKWGTDESKFVEILCRRSIPQLRRTLVEYKNISGNSLQASIEGEMSGDLEELLVAIVKCVKNVPAYLAELLYKSMKGCGTDENVLTRVMVSRSEIDLLDIRAEYKKLYENSLYSDIESDTDGDYGKTLLNICGGDDE